MDGVRTGSVQRRNACANLYMVAQAPVSTYADIVVLTVTVGMGALVGANATILRGLVVGARATVGAGAVAVRDVPPSAIVKGVPAQ